MKRLLARPVRYALLAALLLSLAVGASWPTATQKSEAQGVTLAVTAGNLDEDARIWDFALAFHSKGPPLQDNLMDDVALVARGHRIKPLWWEGAGPTTGTHRAGVLKFIAIQPRPKWVELHVQRPGEARPRVFRWEFGEWVAVNQGAGTRSVN